MEFDEIVVKESPGLCRCCLSEGCYKDLGSEYTWMNDTEVYADMLLECFDISISQHNDGPNGANRLICEVCITRLRDACNFKKQVLDSEKKFIDMVARGEFRPKVLVYQTQTMKPEPITEESHREEAEIEYLEDEMDFGDDEPLKRIEALDEVTEDPTVSEDITVATLPVKGKRGRPRKSDTPAKPERKAKVPKLEDKPRSSKAIVKEINPITTSAAMRRRKNLVTLFNNTSVIPFKWRSKYLCFYCSQPHVQYEDIVKHTRSHGPCTVRHEALRSQKKNHIEVKLDVTKIICDLCDTTCSNLNGMIDHLIANHNLIYDKDVEMSLALYKLNDLKCLVCGRTFSYFGHLVTHMNMSHPNKSLPCDFCSLSFNKRKALLSHIRRKHRFDGYVCQICKCTCNSKEILNAHMAEQHVTSCVSGQEKSISETKNVEHFKICNSVHVDVKEERLDEKEDEIEDYSQESQDFSGQEEQRKEYMERKIVAQRKRENVVCVLKNTTAIPFRFFKSKFTCFYCNAAFVNPREMREHTATQHLPYDLTQKLPKTLTGPVIYLKVDISCLSCKLCNEPFNDFIVLIDHLVDTHKTDYDKSVTNLNWLPYKLGVNNTPCPLCGEKFQPFNNLLKHMNQKHLVKNRLCTYCGTAFTNDSGLNVHVSMVHGTHKCDICNTEFGSAKKLKSHKAKLHGTKVFSCTVCSEKFPFEYYLQKHMLNVHSVGHKCTYCEKMFVTRNVLSKHIRCMHNKKEKTRNPRISVKCA